MSDFPEKLWSEHESLGSDQDEIDQLGIAHHEELVSPTTASETRTLAATGQVEPTVLPPTSSLGERKSKSQQIRDFLAAHPEVRNKDVALALSQFGVTAADVANVKAHLKRVMSPRTEPATEVGDGRIDVPSTMLGRWYQSTPAVESPRSEFSLEELERAINFIESFGGIAKTRQIIDIVDRIRKL